MKWAEFFTSSIGKKFVMALTGLFLVTFLVVHVGINSCVWANDGGEMFNRTANYMGSTIVVRIVEVGLFVGIFLHIIQGYILEVQNRSRRGVGYAVKMGTSGSTWYSKSMGLLGTLLLIFLVIHWKHFFIPSRFTGVDETIIDGKPVHDLYALMKDTFTQTWVVILYVIGCISLAYHLLHGFLSAFRTLGLRNHRYIRIVRSLGIGFSVIVPLAFAMIPIGMHFGWVN